MLEVGAGCLAELALMLHGFLLPTHVWPVAMLLSCQSNCTCAGAMSVISQLPKAWLKYKLACLEKKFSPLKRDVKHIPRQRWAARVSNWLLSQKKVDQVVCKSDLDQDSYAIINGASLFSLHQIFLLLIRHAWDSLCGGICPDQALEFCFHWNMNKHQVVEFQFQCNSCTVICALDCCMLGIFDERRQCEWPGSMRGFLWYQTRQPLRLYILLFRALCLWTFSGKEKGKAEEYISMWIADLEAWCPIYSQTVLTIKLCMQNAGFLGADAALAVACEDSQHTLCMLAIMDINNFAALCPWKGFSIGIDVWSFKNQDFLRRSFCYCTVSILPYIFFQIY